MKTLSWIVASLLLSTSAASAAPIHLTHVRVIDGTGDAPRDDVTLTVDRGRIISIKPSSVTPPKGGDIRDYRGRTLIPGLVSDHIHVGQVQGVSSGAANYTREVIVAELEAYEAKGVTTVMALGLNGAIFQALSQAAHKGALPGADLFGVDSGIGAPGGAPPVSLGADQLTRPATTQAARDAVRGMKAHGASMVKLWLDDFGGSLPVKIKPEIYEAVIAEAHALDMRVAAHVHDLEDARAIVQAGADILAHGIRDQPVDPAFVALLKAKGTWYIPTLARDEATFVYADRPDWMEDRFFLSALSPALKARFDDPAWRARTLADPKTAAARRDLAVNLKNLKRVFDAGVKVGFGADAGSAPERIPGVAEHRELHLMVEAGLTPLQALTIATANAADLLGLTDRGRLIPGGRADFVVLTADPSRAIGATTRIEAVWRGGFPAS